MINRLGVMQGRLLEPINNKIQSFPKRHWQREFRYANKLSLKFIEWTLDYQSLLKNPLLHREGQKKIKFLSKQNKIKVNSITADCIMQKPFWKNDLKRLDLLKKLKKILYEASKLNIKYLIVPLVDNSSIKSKKQETIVLNEFKKLYSFLKKKKIQILFETDMNPEKCLNFIKKLNKNYFGINYDTGNSASLNYNPTEEFKSYGKYIKNVHIKDRVKFGNTVPLGDGDTNFSLIAKLCKKYKYKGNFILQAARQKNKSELDIIKEYIKFLKENFK